MPKEWTEDLWCGKVLLFYSMSYRGWHFSGKSSPSPFQRWIISQWVLIMCLPVAHLPQTRFLPSQRAGVVSCLLFVLHQAQSRASVRVGWLSELMKEVFSEVWREKEEMRPCRNLEELIWPNQDTRSNYEHVSWRGAGLGRRDKEEPEEFHGEGTAFRTQRKQRGKSTLFC